jgi:hypothetical protein
MSAVCNDAWLAKTGGGSGIKPCAKSAPGTFGAEGEDRHALLAGGAAKKFMPALAKTAQAVYRHATFFWKSGPKAALSRGQ